MNLKDKHFPWTAELRVKLDGPAFYHRNKYVVSVTNDTTAIFLV